MKGEPIVILLVEDNLAHAEIIRRNFEGFRIANRLMHVEDGQAALDYLYRRNEYADPQKSPRPGVVLLDLRLPKVDGIEVLKVIKADEQFNGMPVVILTTSSADTDIARAYAGNANSYLVKPIDFTRFAELMDTLGYYWLAWNEHPFRPAGCRTVDKSEASSRR